MQRAARLANGLQPLAARVRHAAHHTPATGCALLQRTALRCKRCNRLQQSAVGCNRRHCVATGCNRLVRCSGPHCVAIIAATGCKGLWSVATGCGPLQRTALRCNCCNRLQSAAVHGSELWSVATGCAALHRAGLLRHTLYCEQRCDRLQQAVVRYNRASCVATRCDALQQVRLRHGRLPCVATGCCVVVRSAVATGDALCNGWAT